MAFKGDLENLSLFDIFQTLSTNGQTGVLVLSREGATRKVHFAPDGVRVLFARSFVGFRIGDVFVRRGVVTPQDIEGLLREQEREYRPMGELLIESGKVTEDDVRRVLKYHAEDEIFEIFGWVTGQFAFHDGQDITEDDHSPLSDVVLDPASLCLEAARRLDELEQIRTLVPTNTAFHCHNEGAGRPDAGQNDEKVCLVFDALVDAACPAEVQDAVGLSQFDVLRSVFLLLDAGLVRELELNELLDTSGRARDNGDLVRAADLLEHAQSLDPRNREIIESCVEITRTLDDPARHGTLLASLGALCVQDGDVQEGVQCLERALKLQPSNVSALTSLRDAYASQGNVELCATVSLKLARLHAEAGRLFRAVETANTGLECSPKAIALRYYLAQLLARTSRTQEAKDQVYHLIDLTKASKGKALSGKGHELLVSCYRLLLKIDPEDENAVAGRAALDRERLGRLRNRRLLTRGSIAAAVLLVAAGIGFISSGPSAQELLALVGEAARANDRQTLLSNLDELVRRFPDSPEAEAALRLKSGVSRDQAGANDQHRRNQDDLRRDLEEELDRVRRSLAEDAPEVALRHVPAFLEELAEKRANFLRRELGTHLQHAIGVFLDRVRKEYERDMRTFAQCNVHLSSNAPKAMNELLLLEHDLEEVRAHNWREGIPAVGRQLDEIATSKLIQTKLAKRMTDFKSRWKGATFFASVDNLYFVARARRLRTQIDKEYEDARRLGREALEQCDFDTARMLYESLNKLVRTVDTERPREHFLDLLAHLERGGIRKEAEGVVAEVREIEVTLEEIARLREEGGESVPQAFRLLRKLVNSNRLVRFEGKYRFPYLVRSVPAGSEVLVDGEAVGTTPVAVEIPIYARTRISVKRDGFTESLTDIEPLDAQHSGALDVLLQKTPIWTRQLNGAVEAEPMVLEGLLVIASRDGRLYGLDPDVGTPRFVIETGVLEGMRAAPVADEQYFYIPTLDGTIHVASRETNQIVSRIPLPSQIHHGLALHDGVVFVATQEGRLVAIKNKKILWNKPMAHTPSTAVLHSDGKLYIGTMEGLVLVHKASDGTELDPIVPRFKSSFLADLALHKGAIVAGSENGKIRAFDVATRGVRWTVPTRDVVRSRAIVNGDMLYIGSLDGFVYGIRSDGSRRVRLDLGAPITGSVALHNGFLYAANTDRGLAAFDVSGNRAIAWWTRQFEDETVVHITTTDTHIFVVTDKSNVHAFAADKR